MTAIAIIVGSQLGSAEYVADQLQAALQDQHIESELYLTPELAAITQKIWLIVTSTYGAGDYPDNLLPFIAELNDCASLAEVSFAVVGIGDSNYDTYNLAASNCAALLQAKGAQALLPTFTIDVQDEALPEDSALLWLPAFMKQLAE
ncbi:flavodoxin domain-containing protein [Pseudoalteromonas fenneropenaei]|uniref:Flavodoxin domain-containing protein n=1 Tax=Pseudoalteromonas fenneropenaei TaxID=1737459 RepID=A0ABV7CLB0_9GAMM